MLSFIRKRIILTPTHYVGPKACISHTFIYKWPNVHLLPVPSMLVGWQCLTMQPGKVKFALSFLDLQWHTHSPILGFFSELCYFSLLLYLKAASVPILFMYGQNSVSGAMVTCSDRCLEQFLRTLYPWHMFTVPTCWDGKLPARVEICFIYMSLSIKVRLDRKRQKCRPYQANRFLEYPGPSWCS